MRKRHLFASLMCLAISITALAANGTLPGAGTEADPYRIEDLADFDAFANPANAATYWSAGVHTKLTTDIDLSGRTYTTAVISSANQTFSGNFDGQNHIISNLTVTGSRLCSLFGTVEGTSSKSAILQNIVLQQCNISSDAAYNGCLIGWAKWYVIVQNCHIKQSQVTSPYDLIGGLIGLAGSTLAVNPDIMVSMCSVVDSNVSGGNLVGGLIGAATPVNLQNCYANCTVQGTGNGIGGLVGEELDNNVIINSYSAGFVSGFDKVGGLIGSNTGSVENCYSASVINGSSNVGGICGMSSGNITNSFWDVDTSGIGSPGDDNYGAIGKTTAEMMTQSTFAGWNFATPVWMMLRPGEDYPRLAWQEVFDGDIAGLYGVDMVDFAYLANYWGLGGCDSGSDCGRADVDGSGDVGLPDLAAVANDWLK